MISLILSLALSAAPAPKCLATGTVAGKPFCARSVMLTPDPAAGVDGAMVLRVYEKKYTCDTVAPDDDERWLDVGLTWVAGGKADAEHVQFTKQGNGGELDAHPADSGGVTVVSVKPAKVSIDAKTKAGDALKATLSVEQCAK